MMHRPLRPQRQQKRRRADQVIDSHAGLVVNYIHVDLNRLRPEP
jgi:hypothetical protein